MRLSLPQQQALSGQKDPFLMLAVPGSGKTTVLVARTAYLLDRGVPPEQICSLTFSRESAADMRRRFQQLFEGLFPAAPSFSTIHSLCWRILHDFSTQSGRALPRLTGSESSPGSAALVRRCVEALTGTSPDEDQLSELLHKIGLCKNRRLSRQEILSLQGMPDHFATLYSLYEKEKKSEGLMDYDDLLLYALDILEKRPAFCSQWQRRYQYWNIDEGQDLSPVQHALLQILCPEGKGLFLVGDEDQSIYGFRGADPGGLLRFPQSYPHARIAKMEDNHRSRPEILSLCESFIRSMPERYDKRLLPTRPPGGEIERVSPSTLGDSLQTLLDILKENPPGRTTGLLYRSNLSACLLSVFLREAGVPFRLDAEPVTLLRYYAKSMYALLTVCAEPYNLDAFHQTGCHRMLGTPLYENIFLRADGTRTVPQLLRDAASRLPHRKNALELADALEACAGLPPARALPLLETRTAPGRAAFARWRGGGDPLVRMRYTQLRWLCQTSPDFPTLQRRVSEAAAPSAFQPEEALVTLSTIHSAKGLEFDTVLLLDCYDGILPARGALAGQKAGDPAAFYEEQRLFYVAATRAKERLFLFEPPTELPNTRLSRFGSAFLQPARRRSPPILFQEGDRVHHAGFGDGILIKRSGDLAEILFDLHGAKKLSLSHCIQKHFISKLAD